MGFEELSDLSINDLWERLQETDLNEKAETALVLSRRLCDQRSYAESVAVCEQAVQIGEQLKDSRVQGEGWFRVGVCSFALERYEESADAYLKSVPFYLSESDESSAASAIRHAVDGLQKQSKHEDVVRVCLEGETYAQISDHEHLLAELLASRATALIELERYTEALSVLEAVRPLWKNHQQIARVIATDMQRGDCYDALDESERAIAMFKNAYELAVASDSRKMIVYQGLRLARAYDMADDFPAVERVLTRAYEVAAHHDDIGAMASCNAWMSNIYRQTDRAELAFDTASNALTLFDSIGVPDEFDRVIAAAVISPIAIERLDFVTAERVSRILVDYYFLEWRDLDAATDAGKACLDLYEAQVEMGTFTGISEDHSKLLSRACHRLAENEKDWFDRRRFALSLESTAVAAAAGSENWEELEEAAARFIEWGRPADFSLLDARAYVLLAKAQAALSKPSSGSLAMAAAIYFNISRFDIGLEVQEQALKAAVAELTPQWSGEPSHLP